MQRNSLTQSKLDDMVKIRQTTISDYVNGKSVPSAEVLLRLSHVFGCSMEWLCGGGIEEVENSLLEADMLARENLLLKDRLKALSKAIKSVLEEYEC